MKAISSLSGAVSLLLLACLAFASADQTPTFWSDELVEEAMASAQAAMAAADFELPAEGAEVALARLEKMMLDNLEAKKCGCKCCKCTKASAKWVMKHVIGFIKYKCNTTTVPKVEKKCAMAAKHPAVALGYLIAAVRPVSLGYAWCSGKGACSKNTTTSTPAAMAEANELALMASAKAPTLEQEVLLGDSIEGLLAAVEADPSLALAGEEAVALPEEEDAEEAPGRPFCKKCIIKVSKFVMFKTVAKIKAFCKKTTCPKAKAKCAAAKAHPGVTFGYLLYKIRPTELAIGYCLGKGACGMKDSLDVQPLEFADAEDEIPALAFDSDVL